MLGKYEYSVVQYCVIKNSSYTWSRLVSNNEHRDLTMCQVIRRPIKLKTTENYELNSPKNVVAIAYKSLVTVVVSFFEMLERQKALTENFSVLDM